MRSLRANMVRSVLTMLGIIIGVASVITMVAVGSGAQTQIAEQIQSLGANVLLVLPGATHDSGVRQRSGTMQTLSERDADAISSEIPYVDAVAPSARGRVQLVAGNRNWNARYNGTTSDYFAIREWALSEGRFFSDQDITSAAKVVIIGRTVADQLFDDGTKPIGQTVRVMRTPLTVIGVLEEKGLSGTGRDQDDVIFVPISTAKRRLLGTAHQVNRDAVAYILAKAKSEETMALARSGIISVLRQRHRILEDEPNDFSVANPAAAMKLERAATQTIAWLLAGVASVSLLVGGISIMNIMLVSVTERTREIGIRLAVGARRRDIRNQFLLEAVTLCVFGCLIGILFGIGISASISKMAGWPIIISPHAVVAALVFAGSIGVFFGYYPARRASLENPIVCLRSD